MNTFDEMQVHELLKKGKRSSALQVIMQQANMSLKDAVEYIDDYCRQEKIVITPANTSYSATNENGIITYYKTENGEKRIISKEEAPDFVVSRMESSVNKKPKKQFNPDKLPNYKKLRKFLIYVGILLIALAIFFLYNFFTKPTPSVSDYIGGFACGEIAFLIYIIVFVLWIIESKAKRQKDEEEEMGIPYEFVIKGGAEKTGRLILNFLLFLVWGIAVPYFFVVLFTHKEYWLALLCLAFFVAALFFILPCDIRDLKNSQKSLHISGTTIRIYQRSKEIATISAATAVCEILCVWPNGITRAATPMTYQLFGPRREKVYPRAQISRADGTLLAEVFLSLQEYRLLRKYLIQHGSSLTDHYNPY